MTEEQIYQKIEEIYNSEKGKNFITHLLRSFLPVNRSREMMENERSLKMVDCITGEKLCTKNEQFAILMSKEGMDTMMEDFNVMTKAMVDGKDSYTHPESVHNLRKKLKPVAVTCKKSDKVMSEETLGQLFNFFASELLRGNKHINWIANNERGKEFVKHGKKEGYIKTKREEKVVQKASERAKMSLKDNDVLKQLKKRMEDEKGI